MDENLLLSLIENNAKMEVVDLAAALNETEENVDKTIKDLEKNKTIYGYHTLINWDKTNHDVCTAVIQVNAKPERDYGYDRIAKKIYNFPEVDTMYLLAGNYEFLLIVKGKTMVEVAKFVNSRLAVIEGIERTATMYVLKQYKRCSRKIIGNSIMDFEKIVNPIVKDIPPSGIRKFFDLANQMEGVISLGVGEPDFATPWTIREAAIYSIEKGKTFYTANQGLL